MHSKDSVSRREGQLFHGDGRLCGKRQPPFLGFAGVAPEAYTMPHLGHAPLLQEHRNSLEDTEVLQKTQ